MYIHSVGIDIEKISRFSSHKYEINKSFYEKIFTHKEIEYCLKRTNPYPHFTVRFCAKEAAVKALNNKKIKLSNIEIIIKDDRPILKLPNGKRGLVAMSHTREYAVAFVAIT